MWAHADADKIELTGVADSTIAYAWGDKTLAVHSCKCCGCTTHWTSLDPEVNPRGAVNCRVVDTADIIDLRIRDFDGADSWEYLS